MNHLVSGGTCQPMRLSEGTLLAPDNRFLFLLGKGNEEFLVMEKVDEFQYQLLELNETCRRTNYKVYTSWEGGRDLEAATVAYNGYNARKRGKVLHASKVVSPKTIHFSGEDFFFNLSGNKIRYFNWEHLVEIKLYENSFLSWLYKIEDPKEKYALSVCANITALAQVSPIYR